MEELALKIDTLTQLYTQIESHLSDSITWFLTVFFGAITVIVLALVFLVKTSIQRGVDKASNGLNWTNCKDKLTSPFKSKRPLIVFMRVTALLMVSENILRLP